MCCRKKNIRPSRAAGAAKASGEGKPASPSAAAEKREHRPISQGRNNPLKTGRSGQAITEYALLSVVMTLGVLFMGTSFFPAFVNAFQRYFDSFYILINLPIP
jgi:hypothetical protein